jgi:hypothetical protein
MDKKNSISLEDLAFKFVPIQASLLVAVFALANWLAGTDSTSESRAAALILWFVAMAVGWVMIFPMYVAKNFKIEIEIGHKKKENGDG